MINIENLTLKEIKLISDLLNNKNEVKKEDGRYVIVRTYSAGVFAGNIESRNGREVILRNARRLWYWNGASTLSQLAMEGTKKPNECKFPCAVNKVEILETIEILDCTSCAEKSIKDVPVWSQ